MPMSTDTPCGETDRRPRFCDYTVVLFVTEYKERCKFVQYTTRTRFDRVNVVR